MILVFDVDGTILDSYEVVKRTYIELFREALPDYTYTKQQLLSFFGPPLYDTFYSITKDEHLSHELVNKYRVISKKITPLYMKAYPGVKETLLELKQEGYHLAVLSNKIKQAILEGFAICGLDHIFDYIVGYEDMSQPKPNPEGLQTIINHFQDQAIMIGDSVIDMITAKNANCPAIGITWALTSAEELKQAGATFIIHDIKAIKKYIRR